MVDIYTDSSVVGSKAASTTLILLGPLYGGLYTNIFEDVETTTEGELLAIIQSIKEVKRHYPEEKDLQLMSDCSSVVNIGQTIIDSGSLPDNVKCSQRYEELLEECSGLNITIKHVLGHMNNHNANKVCDRLSRIIAQGLR